MQSFNQSAFAQREEIIGKLDRSLDTDREKIRQIQGNIQDQRGAAYDRLREDLADLQARAWELRDSMTAAREIGPEGWSSMQTQVDQAYQHYVEARARVESATGNR